MKKNVILLSLLGIIVIPGIALAASISGKVVFNGKVPGLKPLDMNADPMCAAHHKTPPMVEILVLGDGNSLANVFVSVASGLPQGKTYAAPKQAVTIDQNGCMYIPHVFGVMAGQPVVFKNSDGIMHNIHALPEKNRQFNAAMPGTLKETSKMFDKAESYFKIKCDVHPWMGAWARVMDHPYFQVTDKKGIFTIADLPAGTYEIEAWHEKLGVQKSKVTVGDKESKTLNFTFTAPSK